MHRVNHKIYIARGIARKASQQQVSGWARNIATHYTKTQIDTITYDQIVEPVNSEIRSRCLPIYE